MKKIISFSIWGSKPKYTKAALLNIELAKEIYPGWTCRFYVDDSVPLDIQQELSLESEVIKMPISDGNYGMFWRFLPLDDENIERFIVRDTDSRLNPREAHAVLEWEESGKIFHTMRDNVQHDPVPVCGGMWGAMGTFKPEYDRILKNWLSINGNRIFGHPRGKYFFIDQSFLQERIWPLVVNKSITHVSYASIWPGLKVPFKVKNPDESFVGQPYDYE